MHVSNVYYCLKRSRLRILNQIRLKLKIMNKLDSFLFVVIVFGILLMYVITMIDIVGFGDKILFTIVFLPMIVVCLCILKEVWSNK